MINHRISIHMPEYCYWLYHKDVSAIMAVIGLMWIGTVILPSKDEAIMDFVFMKQVALASP